MFAFAPADLPRLDSLASIPADAKARVADTSASGRLVVVPERSVLVGGRPQTAWYDIDPIFRRTIGVTGDGGHLGLIEYAAILLKSFATGIAFGYLAFYVAPGASVDEAKVFWGCGLGLAGAVGNAYANTTLVSGGALGSDPHIVLAGGTGAFFGSIIGVFVAGLALERYLVAGKDPPADLQLNDIGRDLTAANSTSAVVARPAAAAVGSGPMARTATITSMTATGGLLAGWSSAGVGVLQIASLSASSAHLTTRPTTRSAGAPSAFRLMHRRSSPAQLTTRSGRRHVLHHRTQATGRVQAACKRHTRTVPAGQTGILGLSLQPLAGDLLPAPGTALAFTVTATSTTDPTLTQTQPDTFTMQEVHAVALAATPTTLNTTPGQPATVTLTVRAAGNVSVTVTFAALCRPG